MHSASILSCIITMIFSFTIFFQSFMYLFSNFLYKYNKFLRFYEIRAALLLIIFFFFLKFIIFIDCSLKDSQKCLLQFLTLFTSCLSSKILNKVIIDIEKPDKIYLLTFVVDDFQGYFYIYQSFLVYIQDLHK